MKETIHSIQNHCLRSTILTLMVVILMLGSTMNGWGQTVVDIAHNGNFENWTDGKPDNWLGSTTNIPLSGIQEYTTSAFMGSSACQLIRASATHARFSTQALSIFADIEYTVRYYARGKGEIRNAFYRNGNYSGYSDYTVLDTDSWTEIVYTFEFGTAQSDVEVIFSVRNTHADRDHIQIDAVEITYHQPDNPMFMVSPASLDYLDYLIHEGPGISKSFNVSGLNLNNADVTISATNDFEISQTEDGTYGPSVTLRAYDGAATDIWVRLPAGLAVDDYSGDIAISGGGADPTTVVVSGRVIEGFNIPWVNGLRLTDDFNKAVMQGFIFDGAIQVTTADGYVRISNTGSIETPTIDFTQYDALLIGMDLTTFGGNTGQTLSVQISNDNGERYATVNSFAVPASYQTFAAVVDLTGAHNVENGKLRMVISSGSNQVRFRDFSVDEYTFATNTFLGAAAWSSESNWAESEPGISTDATVFGDVTVTSAANVNNLIINNGFTLTVSSSGSLTVKGTLTNKAGPSGILIKSDDTGTGSLIHNAPGAEATLERYIPPSRGSSWIKYDFPTEWFYIASPVADQSIVGFLSKYSHFDLYCWDESSDFWLNYENENFVYENFDVGVGYLFASPDAETPEFSGELYVGDARWDNLSRKGEGYPDPGKSYDYYDAGWHLLGNPYASGIERTGWTTTNLVATPKIWLDGGYVDVDTDEFIPAMTGFIMQVDTGNDDNNELVIPASSRQHTGTLPSPPAEKAIHVSTQRIRLITKAMGSRVQQQSIILLQPDADQSFDPRFDSRFLQGHAPELYSLKSDERLSTQAVDTIHSDLIIPFVFRKNDEGSEFQIALQESIPGTTPYLYDRKMEVEHALCFDNPYVFTTEDTDNPLRFELRFTELGKEPASFPKQEHFRARIFANQQTLTIEQNDITSERTLEIFDLGGRLLIHQQLDTSPQHQQQLNLNPGIYMVRLLNNKSVQTEKIIITR